MQAWESSQLDCKEHANSVSCRLSEPTAAFGALQNMRSYLPHGCDPPGSLLWGPTMQRSDLCDRFEQAADGTPQCWGPGLSRSLPHSQATRRLLTMSCFPGRPCSSELQLGTARANEPLPAQPGCGRQILQGRGYMGGPRVPECQQP